ncbi:MAG TPA: MlaD family protein [Phycisphaerales bacterium]|nr:MlaD family protein [Phycisphaerales bacterium]HMP36556.1 MlaD family protein [Phycisphaerales bacterium]
MHDRTRNLVTGAVAIVALLGFAFLLMRFGELESLRAGRWPLRVALNDAGGLRAGSTATLNGVPIGRVETVTIATRTTEPGRFDPSYPVLATVLVEPGIDIPRGVTATIQSSLIGGSAILHLETDAARTDFSELLARDGSALLLGRFESLGTQVAEAIGAELRPFSEGLGGMRGSVERLIETYTRLGDDLGDLVAPLSDEELADGAADNLRITITRLNVTLAEMREGIAGLRRWAEDEGLQNEFVAAVSEARSTMQEVRSTVGRYGELAEGLQRDAERLAARLVPAADELSATLMEVRSLVAAARSPQGSLGLLLGRPDVHDALLDSTRRLDRALAEAELLLRKIRQEGLSLDLK